MDFVISYNKRIPPKENAAPGGRMQYQFREQCMRILRGEVKNVVYTVHQYRMDYADRINKAAMRYVKKNALPLVVVRRRNHVFIRPIPSTMEKKKAQA